MTTRSPPARRRTSSLFWRIYVTVVVTVLAGTAVGAVATWGILHQRSEAWVAQTLEVLENENDALVAKLADRKALGATVEELSSRLRTHIFISRPDGRPLAGTPDRPHRRKGHHRALRRGHPRVIEREDGRQRVLFPLTHPESGRSVALVSVRPRAAPPGMPMVISLVAILTLLGLSARALSRSLTSRLARLEASADRIANGELSHRVDIQERARLDEIDELAISFNDMADKVEALLQGQRVLLANVSHELRTPIARVKVVLEILETRTQALRTSSADDAKHLARLEKGLSDIGRDTEEIEKLISDLLTSGRLDLSAAGGNLQLSTVALDKLAERMAERFDATVQSVTKAPQLAGDAMLLERLLSNLLSNARRACPDGALTISIAPAAEQPDGSGGTQSPGYVLAVEDEGRGIAPADREAVFEPFRRLDAARNRDKGGVGLGLYLCRQIARAHGGDVVAQARADGHDGARLQVSLPTTPPQRS